MKKKVLWILVITLSVIIATSCTDIENRGSSAEPVGGEIVSEEPPPKTTPQTALPPEPEPQPEPVPEYLTVSAVAVGDNLIHSSIYNQAHRRHPDEGRYDFGPAYENVRHMIEPFELAMINQETLICNDIYPPSNYPRFNSPNDLGDFMLDMGFNAMTIANNHTLDKGTEGLTACLNYWRERSDRAVVVGAYYDEEERKNFNRFMEINGVTFSFLGYAESLNGLVLPRGSPLSIGRTTDIDIMLEEIQRAKENSDFCVVFLHWGAEDYDQIQSYQREAAKKMVEAGADFIHGTHPHVLRDFEWIEREDGTRALVAYSLANFISSQIVPQTMIGGALSFEIVVHNETRAVEIKDVILNPIITHYDGSHNNVRLYPLEMYTRELADNHGIKRWGTFGWDYIFKTLRRTVSPQWLPDWVLE